MAVIRDLYASFVELINENYHDSERSCSIRNDAAKDVKAGLNSENKKRDALQSSPSETSNSGEKSLTSEVIKSTSKAHPKQLRNERGRFVKIIKNVSNDVNENEIGKEKCNMSKEKKSDQESQKEINSDLKENERQSKNKFEEKENNDSMSKKCTDSNLNKKNDKSSKKRLWHELEKENEDSALERCSNNSNIELPKTVISAYKMSEKRRRIGRNGDEILLISSCQDVDDDEIIDIVNAL